MIRGGMTMNRALDSSEQKQKLLSQLGVPVNYTLGNMDYGNTPKSH